MGIFTYCGECRTRHDWPECLDEATERRIEAEERAAKARKPKAGA